MYINDVVYSVNLFINLSIFIEFFSNSKSAPLISSPIDSMLPVLRPHQTSPKRFLRAAASPSLRGVWRIAQGRWRESPQMRGNAGRGRTGSGLPSDEAGVCATKTRESKRSAGAGPSPVLPNGTPPGGRTTTGARTTQKGCPSCLSSKLFVPASIRDISPPRARASLCRLVS